MALDERTAITDHRLLVRCLVVLALVVIGVRAARGAARGAVHRRPARRGRDAAGRPGRHARTSSERSSGASLVFFMGLFVMVGGPGAHRRHRDASAPGRGRDRRQLLRSPRPALLFGSAVLGAFFDNIPYVATMAPIVEGMVAPGPRPGDRPVRCGGRSRSAPTSAATAPPSRPAPTSSRSASPPATGHADQFLAVHPLRHRDHGDQHRDGVGVRGAALLLARRTGRPPAAMAGHVSRRARPSASGTPR